MGKTGLKLKIHKPKITGKIGLHGKIGAGAKAKGGLKIKAKTGAKAKGGLKVKGKAAVKPKLKVKAKVAAKPKLKVKAKGGVKAKAKIGVKAKKMRRLQTAETNISSGEGGLDTTKYAKDVNVPELKGDSDQTAPKSSNL